MGWLSDVWKIGKDIIGGGNDDDEEGGFGWNDAFDLAKGIAPLASGAASFFGQQATNSSNAKQAAAQMAFQERMSSTAYQRATGDMAAAGLNPMLAYQQGGASSPAGASAKFENAAGTGVASALQAQSAMAAVENLKAQTENTNAQTIKTRSETGLTELEATLREAELPNKFATGDQIRQQVKNLEKENDKLREQIRLLDQEYLEKRMTMRARTEREELLSDIASNETELQILQHKRGTEHLSEDQAHGKFYRETGTLSDYVRLGSEGIGGITSALRARQSYRLGGQGRLIGRERSTHGNRTQETYDYER